MTDKYALYLHVAGAMRMALADAGLDAEAAAVLQSLRSSVSEAIEVGWQLISLNNIQFYLTFEDELTAFQCLSHLHDDQIRRAAREMLQDYVNKNEDQVAQFLGEYNTCCAPFLLAAREVNKSHSESIDCKTMAHTFERYINGDDAEAPSSATKKRVSGTRVGTRSARVAANRTADQSTESALGAYQWKKDYRRSLALALAQSGVTVHVRHQEQKMASCVLTHSALLDDSAASSAQLVTRGSASTSASASSSLSRASLYRAQMRNHQRKRKK